jgi:hypothetical protein
MLRASDLQYERNWDKSLPYAKFSYNSSYQESFKMTPFEMLYGHRCRTPLFWGETGERKIFGPDILQEAEKQVRMVRENLRVAQSRQKSYVDHIRRELSFEVGDFVYLKVSPMRGLRHFKVRGKITSRIIDPFKTTEEREEESKVEFPNFFFDPSESRSKIHLRGVGLSHQKIPNFGMRLKFTKF